MGFNSGFKGLINVLDLTISLFLLISIGCGRRGAEFETRQGKQIFLFFKTPTPVLKTTQPPFPWVLGGFFPR